MSEAWPKKKAYGYAEALNIKPLPVINNGVRWSDDKVDGYNQAIDECLLVHQVRVKKIVKRLQITNDILENIVRLFDNYQGMKWDEHKKTIEINKQALNEEGQP